jgi:hypothetical protein
MSCARSRLKSQVRRLMCIRSIGATSSDTSVAVKVSRRFTCWRWFYLNAIGWIWRPIS